MKRVTAKELQDAISRLPQPYEWNGETISIDIPKPETCFIGGAEIADNMTVNLIRFIKSDDKQSWELLAIGGL